MTGTSTTILSESQNHAEPGSYAAIGGHPDASMNHPAEQSACLTPFGGSDDIQCVVSDVGPEGAQVTAPIGFGVAIGQRYRFILAPPGVVLGQGSAGGADQAVVTVVRTEILTGEDGDRLGVGLRFDQPLARA